MRLAHIAGLAHMAGFAGLAIAAMAISLPASAVTMQECSKSYQAAKDAGTLNGMKWNDFRKAKCSGDASSAADTAEPAPASKAATMKPAKPAAKPAAKPDTAAAPAAKGLSMQACSDKYQQAKTAGTLGGAKWNDFRKSQCGAAAADDASVPAPSEATYNDEPAKPTVMAPKGARFPTAVSAKYSSESAGKARMHTCLDAYYAAKDADALGGLHWIQKGGGYYSLCNDRLKG